MGASHWHYVVDWTADPAEAFAQLQARTFAAGEYYKVWELYPSFAEAVAPEVAAGDPEAAARMKRGQPPATIRQARAFAHTEGTHSILDMSKIGEGDFGEVRVLPPEEIEATLGTPEPDEATAVAHRSQLASLCPRWQGVVVPIYDAGKPIRYLFSGCSGD